MKILNLLPSWRYGGIPRSIVRLIMKRAKKTHTRIRSWCRIAWYRLQCEFAERFVFEKRSKNRRSRRRRQSDDDKLRLDRDDVLGASLNQDRVREIIFARILPASRRPDAAGAAALFFLILLPANEALSGSFNGIKYRR